MPFSFWKQTLLINKLLSDSSKKNLFRVNCRIMFPAKCFLEVKMFLLLKIICLFYKISNLKWDFSSMFQGRLSPASWKPPKCYAPIITELGTFKINITTAQLPELVELELFKRAAIWFNVCAANIGRATSGWTKANRCLQVTAEILRNSIEWWRVSTISDVSASFHWFLSTAKQYLRLRQSSAWAVCVSEVTGRPIGETEIEKVISKVRSIRTLMNVKTYNWIGISISAAHISKKHSSLRVIKVK